MLRITEVKLPLDHAEDDLRAAVLRRLGIAADRLIRCEIHRRGHDARKRGAIALIYTLDVEVKDEAAVLKRLRGDRHVAPTPDMAYRQVARAPQGLAARPLVIGTGPCGLLAGLMLARMGFRPILLERGKAVRERTRDTWGLWRKGELNPESNVQFGEGGAGTFSDGKLYSQIKDPGHRGRKVLEEFVEAGAPAEILYVSKPHIGTFKLVSMVEHMRATIEALGGEIRFNSRVVDLDMVDGAGARRRAGGRDAHRQRARRAGGGPQRPRHLRHAACARRVHRAETLLHRPAHRASANADRPLPFRRSGRQRPPRRRRLQAGASLRQRPLGIQLLHVSGRHGGRRHLGSRGGW
jgi:uncharacterized protein